MSNKYTELITSEHNQRPKYMAMVEAVTEPVADLQAFLKSIPGYFDLDTAIGVQLDILGEWIGRSRKVKVPIAGVYFSFDDTATVGWDSGVWKGEFDPDSGLVELPDDSYRLLLKAKVAANRWDGTIPSAYDIWEEAFANTGALIIIQDNQDMSMVVGIAGATLDIVSQTILTQGYIPLKPEGVRINYYALSVTDGPLFGWDVENDAISGWDVGGWALELQPS
jgi:hypothetical protein